MCWRMGGGMIEGGDKIKGGGITEDGGRKND